MRNSINHDPYLETDARDWNQRGQWPCHWIACADAGEASFVTAYALHFSAEIAAMVRIHVTADERYELFLDGARLGRGPERGDANNWFFETYDLDLSVGEHTLAALVWSLGERAPFAQMSVRPGFLLSPQNSEWIAKIGTGTAPWQAKKLAGYVFTDAPAAAWGTGANVVIDARPNEKGERFDFDWHRGSGEGWQNATVLDAAQSAFSHNDAPSTQFLRPALLPPMRESVISGAQVRLVADAPSSQTYDVPIRYADDIEDERARWQKLVAGQDSLQIAPHTRRRVLLDLENYYCAYPNLVCSGGAGAAVRIHWQESLYCEAQARTKGNRNEIEGKFFATAWHLKDGIGDTFITDGGANRQFDTLWWQCGRYVEILVETGAEALDLESLTLFETRYPLEMEATFASSEARLESVISIGWRTLQMCAHETYMDCPYYEQLMYVGDTRLEAITTYVATRDALLPAKALALFDASRQGGGALQKGGFAGLTQSRYPTRVRQTIAPFALWWVGMVHDYAMWRDDLPLVRALMLGVRGVVDHFLSHLNAEGLLEASQGWNFTDWVPAWKHGIPPSGDRGVSAILNWQLALVLSQVAQLEAMFEETELAARAHRLASEIAARTTEKFWDEARGLFADDATHQHFSEHAQCLAILSGQLSQPRLHRVTQGLLHDPDLARTTIYFSHYLFEALAATGNANALLQRLDLWFDLEKQGFKTTYEQADPNTSRSDCHAWGAHPIYHAFASLLGIRPAAPGFTRVRIAPQMGTLSRSEGRMPHPRGEIAVKLERVADKWKAEISLPDGVEGEFHMAGHCFALHSGIQRFQFESDEYEI